MTLFCYIDTLRWRTHIQLKGIYGPIVTPFNNDESISYEVLKKLIDFVLANGMVGLVPGGET
jgi:4-hydroxy-tetrahydrodipicolinate synthase